jgi:hypothetical protein
MTTMKATEKPKATQRQRPMRNREPGNRGTDRGVFTRTENNSLQPDETKDCHEKMLLSAVAEW